MKLGLIALNEESNTWKSKFRLKTEENNLYKLYA